MDRTLVNNGPDIYAGILIARGGHMHFNQQQNFEYNINRQQNLLPKSTHCHYTISIDAMELLVRQEVGQ